MGFKKLFEKGFIGRLEVKNRIVMPCTSLNYCRDNFVTQKLIDFYAERASGGAGLIIVGACQVDQRLSYWSPLNLSLGDEALLPSIRRLSAAIHDAGAKCAVQIFHAGKFARLKDRAMKPLSASALYSNLTRETPREATRHDIEMIQEGYALAAEKAKGCGFDAVELNCSSGYIIREFLSPTTNKRADEYGGSLANRTRFLMEVIEKCKARAGRDYPIICRLSADEFLPEGNGLLETIEIAKGLERSGLDAIDVFAGGHETTIPISPARVPKGVYLHYARQIKEAVALPIIAGTRINDPRMAEEYLADGYVDFISMARPLIADPHLPRKAMEGHLDDIRPCIACNEGCFDSHFTEREVSCTINPWVGREGQPRPAKAASRKKVLIIGGGPAGLSAAIAASGRGHEVVLYERGKSLGGQINLARSVPGKADFERAVSFWARELVKSGGKIILGKEVTREIIEAEAPDAAVVATGSIAAIPNIPGVDGPNVATARQILSGEVVAGKRVAIIGGGATGCEVALYLAEKGAIDGEMATFLLAFKAIDPEKGALLMKPWRDITVVEMLKRLGSGIGVTTRWSTLLEMRNLGIKTITEAKVRRIRADGIEVERGAAVEFIPADTVVVAVGSRPEDSLVQLVKASIKEAYIIGDAAGPRKLIDAVREGHEAGSSV